MATYTVPEVSAFLCTTVWIELAFDDPDDGPFHRWSCVQVVGAVLPLPGIYEHGHFLGFDLFEPDKYPCEYFWSDIVSMVPVRSKPGRPRSKRANGSSRRERAHASAKPKAGRY